MGGQGWREPECDTGMDLSPVSSIDTGQSDVGPEEALGGNAFEQDRLLGCATAEGVDIDGDSDDDPTDPLLLAFMEQHFTLADNVPSTGFGCFDAQYYPHAGVLQIILRVGFSFEQAPDQGWGDWWEGKGEWTDVEKQDWIAAFVQSVQTTWATEHTMRCTRPGGCLEVLPMLQVIPVAEGDRPTTT